MAVEDPGFRRDRVCRVSGGCPIAGITGLIRHVGGYLVMAPASWDRDRRGAAGAADGCLAAGD